LLDFGIANLLATDPGEAVTAAEATARLMTPDYANPERLRGGAITTATDAPALQISNWLVGHLPSTRYTLTKENNEQTY
jgi:serine/threonine protein kinase